ncbi:MAG: hypothetical protein Kow0069_18080 [Promethearchaeota archaeon]
MVVTYHDPCHLGFYEPPRRLLKLLPGVKLKEMARTGNHSWCCGAGGGVKIGYPEWALDVAVERVEEAAATGASKLVTSCPFCEINLAEAASSSGFSLEVVDLVEPLDGLL